jgi:hypothetical protein
LNWSDEFEDPVPGRRTLQDAADHILKLSKAQQQSPHWQPAVEALVMAAEDRGPLLHARRDAAGDEPWQGTGVFRSQRDTLGQAEAEEGSLIAVDMMGRLHVRRRFARQLTTVRITHDADYHQASGDCESPIKYQQIMFRHERPSFWLLDESTRFLAKIKCLPLKQGVPQAEHGS